MKYDLYPFEYINPQRDNLVGVITTQNQHPTNFQSFNTSKCTTWVKCSVSSELQTVNRV